MAALSIDLVPTLLDWLGGAIPPELDGASLLPFLSGQTLPSWREIVQFEYHFRSSAEFEFGSALGLTEDECMMTVLRDDRFKHVFFPNLPPILIDLTEDPGELRNVAAEPRYSGIERDYLAEQLRLRILHADRRLSTTVLRPSGMTSFSGPPFLRKANTKTCR